MCESEEKRWDSLSVSSFHLPENSAGETFYSALQKGKLRLREEG